MAKAKKKTKRAAKKFTCDLCGKKFSMPAHLGRHKSTIHGTKPKTAKKTKKKVAKRGGRPPAIATKFRLRDLPIDDLAALIKAAKQEADRRLREYRALVGA